jgi:hypothetical protein
MVLFLLFPGALNLNKLNVFSIHQDLFHFLEEFYHMDDMTRKIVRIIHIMNVNTQQLEEFRVSIASILAPIACNFWFSLKVGSMS